MCVEQVWPVISVNVHNRGFARQSTGWAPASKEEGGTIAVYTILPRDRSHASEVTGPTYLSQNQERWRI